MSQDYDIAIVGSGFAGSLMAMIARRLGRSVVLLERGRHPRFMIGESSTPLSNLLLEELAERYDLPRIKPLSKWGTWQQSYPQIGCGLKRGFTFYHHRLGEPDAPDPEHRNQLLVAASPHDKIADTHWYRADFDHLLVRQAQDLGVEYLDEVKLGRFATGHDGATIEGQRHGRDVAFRVKFVVDATGPRGFLHRALQLPESAFPEYPTTQALFSHFSNVGRIDEVQSHGNGEEPPYSVDDAAVHHLFDGGWIWVLRFNNGITSAGVAATEETAARLGLADGEAGWARLMDLLPCLKEQFSTAKAELPFTFVQQLSFLSGAVCGDRWALLPSAAGFVDPLLSTGFPLTLLGIGRLAGILESDWDTPRMNTSLKEYAAQTLDDLDATARLIGGLYRNFANFNVFATLSLLYFTAASYSETARRLKKPELAGSFLLREHAVFGPRSRALLERAQHAQSEEESAALIADILRLIEPLDVAGLSKPKMRNWYPVNAEDLFRSASKLGATHEEIAQLLQRCGFLA